MTLGCSESTVSNRLASLGFRKIFSTWVPHELRESDRACRVSIAESLLLRPHRKDLLNGIVTGDESWVMYVNDTRKRVWLPKGELPPKQSKRGLQQKKILLCCWWNCDGMLYYEFLESGTTVTATTYSNQLQKVADAILHKYPKRLETYLLHDNARPHVVTMTRQKIQELGWEVLPHPPYSPDLAPSDYHLFRALKRHLRDKTFDNQEQLKLEVGNFFSTQSADFWRSGIDKLPVKWMKVIDNNGDYITD
uniref:Transposase n=1 Tax=Haemonchus contortus TaxID=6289 RepID=A0A7I4YP87_HAECO